MRLKKRMLALSRILHSFFLNSKDVHRDLRSFPTRRSSDLARQRSCRSRRVKFWKSRGLDRACERDFQNRSEEHTSELQSRLHLVCRLLLEKKKNKTIKQIAGIESTTPRKNTNNQISSPNEM